MGELEVFGAGWQLVVGEDEQVDMSDVLDLLDTLEAELWAFSPVPPSPEHLAARRLLEKLGRR